MNAFYENKIIGTGKVEDDLKNPYVKTVYSFRDLYETTKTKGPQSNAFKDQSLDLANAFNLFVAQKNAHGIPEDENLKTTKNTLEDNIIEEPLAKKIMRPHDLEGNLS